MSRNITQRCAGGFQVKLEAEPFAMKDSHREFAEIEWVSVSEEPNVPACGFRPGCKRHFRFF